MPLTKGKPAVVRVFPNPPRELGPGHVDNLHMSMEEKFVLSSLMHYTKSGIQGLRGKHCIKVNENSLTGFFAMGLLPEHRCRENHRST